MPEVNAPQRSSRSDRLVRTLIALSVLLVFVGALGYSLWPQLLPGLAGLVNQARRVGAEKVESKYFDIRNDSGASPAQLAMTIRTLETDYQAILDYLHAHAGDRHLIVSPIPVFFTDGSGPAMAEGKQLDVFFDNGVIDLDTAPFFLVLLINGDSFPTPENLFLGPAYALYVSEEIGRADGFIRQPSDVWVELLRQKNALLPLEEAWDIQMPTDEESGYNFLRALLEGASFLRWIATSFGDDALQSLLNGQPIKLVTGLSHEQAQQAWLDSLAAQNLQPKSCRLATYGSFLAGMCELLERTP